MVLDGVVVCLFVEAGRSGSGGKFLLELIAELFGAQARGTVWIEGEVGV